MKQEFTSWFRCDRQQPTIPGWYDIAYDIEERQNPAARMYWDGLRWLYSPNNPNEPLFGNVLNDLDNDSWRGLANPPKETKQKGEK